MKNIVVTCLVFFSFLSSTSANFTLSGEKSTKIVVAANEEQVVHTAVEMFREDYKTVFGANVKVDSLEGSICIGTIGLNTIAESLVELKDIKELQQHNEGFLIRVKGNKLIVLGSDKRGTAYGVLELSRMIGVSPWVWWGDSYVEKKKSLEFDDNYRNIQYPSVARRGIFLNDEDWGITPWSWQTYEPTGIKGQIGPKTHARIFELLLRLRANTFWPAMHKCSVPFFMTPGNKEMADKYGIYIGTSHCEPMVRNTNGEWDKFGKGDYDYINNKKNVLKFWEERVKLLAGSDNIYTLGMRGKHDGPMNGVKSDQDRKEALTNIIADQREMIAKYVNPDVTKVSQVFIPYHEVLDAYNLGLKVPDDVTLVWCDDNYGYIRHFPDSIERARKGGNGIYYHLSYWGRPHDYLWLSSNHPALIYNQLKLGYEKGIKDLWVVNVGDIKPTEYLLELIMDLAWNIDCVQEGKDGLDGHLYNWLAREFGKTNADELLPVMNEYYRLAYIHKPEFMGNTRIEEKDPKYKIVSDLPWSKTEIENRIHQYEAISDKVKEISATIPVEKQAAWFEFVEYPVRGAAEMNKKHLFGQLARHGLAEWQKSDTAYNVIVALTEKYNSLCNGKWNKMMSFCPRNLSVFQEVDHVNATDSLVADVKPLAQFNGNEFAANDGVVPLQSGLGYERAAISLAKGSSVTYRLNNVNSDSVRIEVAFAPNHPVEGGKIRYAISVNNGQEQVKNYVTIGRSEEWKVNVLYNQAKVTTHHQLTAKGQLDVKITAMDEGVIIDQIKIFDGALRN